MKRVKEEIEKLGHHIGRTLNDQNLMKVINCRVTPVADYVLNVCNLGKGNSDKLNMIVKSVLWRERFHGRQSCDEIIFKEKERWQRIEKF